jgi:hypothetical protein
MSQNIVPVPVLGVKETVTDVGSKRSYALVQGNQNVNYQAFTSTSYSNSQIQHSIQVPSRSTIVDRNIMVETSATFTFTGPDSGGPLLELGTNDGLACFPLSRCCETFQGQIDQAQISNRMADVMQAFQRYALKRHLINSDLSGAPSMSDQFADLGDWTFLGGAKNPLAQSGDNVFQEPRGSFAGLTVISNTNTSAEVRATWVEPVFCAPFLYGGKQESGIYGCQQIQLSYNLGDLSRMWSHASTGNTLSTVSVTITGARALVAFYTAQPTSVLPRQCVWGYHDATPTITQISQSFAPRTLVGDLIVPGPAQQVQATTITLNHIPQRLYIFARKRKNTLTIEDSDVFAGITGLSIQVGNSPVKLSGATQSQLHKISVNNGLEMSYTQFSRQVGSVVCLDFVKDLGLDPGMAPGVSANVTLQVQATLQNLNPNAQFFDLYVLPIVCGSLSMVDSFFTIQLGLITQQEALLASQQPDHHVPSDVGRMEGEGFFDDLWTGLKSVPKFAWDHRKDIVDGVKGALELKKQLGYGIIGDGIVGDGFTGGRRGGRRGGELLSRAELAARQ